MAWFRWLSAVAPVRRCLPDPFSRPDAHGRDQLVLLGGLCLLLSRCPPKVARRRFPTARAVQRLLGEAARRGRPARLAAEQLSDLAHEIAEHVDPHTRSAVLRCMSVAAAAAAARPAVVAPMRGLAA